MSLRVYPSHRTLFFPEETTGVRHCEGDDFSPEASSQAEEGGLLRHKSGSQ